MTESSDQPPSDANPASPLRRFAPLAVLVAAIAAAYATGVHKYLTLSAIAENRDWLQSQVSENIVLAIGAYMLVYIVATALSLPGGVVLTILGGFLFGWLVGGLTTVVAATIGATAVFLVASTSFGDALTRRAGKFISKLQEGFLKDSFNYLLFLRLVPVFPFWLVNIAPALFNVPVRTFVTATFIGIIPGTFAFCIVGSGLDSIIAAQRAAFDACVADKGKDACTFTLDAGALVTPQLIAGFVALGVVSLIPIAVRHWKERKSAIG